jgi:hypothetical protein
MPANATGFGSLRHLAGRLAGSLWPAGPGRGGEAWAQMWLSPGERAVWQRLARTDRRHAVAVAREVVATVSRGTLRPDVVAAALLHDVGKLESGLGIWGRTAATTAALCLGRPRVAAWARAARPNGQERGAQARAARPNGQERGAQARAARPNGQERVTQAQATRAAPPDGGWRARAGRYVLHDQIGADLLAQAGSADLVVRWAREHHMPAEQWSIDAALGASLKAADGD